LGPREMAISRNFKVFHEYAQLPGSTPGFRPNGDNLRAVLTNVGSILSRSWLACSMKHVCYIELTEHTTRGIFFTAATAGTRANPRTFRHTRTPQAS